MRKSKSIAIAIIILLGIVCVMLVCCRNIESRNYPYKKSSNWICSEPYFTLSYSVEDGILVCSEELHWKNEIIEVELCFLMQQYDVYPAGKSAYEDRLFGGTWKYRGKAFVLKIEEDFIF